jgi:aspartokinase/homoserine dehydrogenase 1
MNVLSHQSLLELPASRPVAGPAPALRPAAPARRVDVVLAGARGQVGSALCRQLARQAAALRDEGGIDLRLVGAFDRHGLARSAAGLDAPDRRTYAARAPGDVDALLDGARRAGARPLVFVDCTASDAIADLYPALLSTGIGVVAANKRANARSAAAWRALQDAARRGGAPYRYETTVGAAIPVLGPLRDLRLRGERVLGLEGVLSGSLAHVLARVHDGLAFSAAVAEARTLGYTEPDPLDDLCAVDLARKALVLARECGFALEPGAVRIEALVDAAAAQRDGLAAALGAQDAPWQARAALARRRRARWVVLVRIGPDGADIGARRVPLSSPFAALPPGQNLLRVRTALQDASPLVLGGPGAGPEVTAAGVLTDLLAAARDLARRAH